MKVRRRAGFTLIEVVVVCLLLGIVAAFAVPQYTRSVETSRANDAASKVDAIAHAHRTFRIDRGQWIDGTIETSCNAGACRNGANGACDLIRCKYLAAEDWGASHYVFRAGIANCGANQIACAQRKTPSNCPKCKYTTTSDPYAAWGYQADTNGIIQPRGNAPPPL